MAGKQFVSLSISQKRNFFIFLTYQLWAASGGGFPALFKLSECSNKPRYSNFIDENLQGDWKTCVVSDEQEEHYAGKFREIFEKFDPFLNADSDDTDVEDEIDGAPSREAIEAWKKKLVNFCTAAEIFESFRKYYLLNC